MLLKNIRITGFKSFADNHDIVFGKGLTAIVGPNGCGKSNIIDAIRWVLGEQRTKVLRSENMSDVIFSGTTKRKPMAFAEVTLSIENNRNILPINEGVLNITRRVFRTGESEYRMNKKLCRLKDITAIFYDTGMGLGAYSLMEAKMIDLILSDKDEERRGMFEEASGINKYRKQRKETLRNLIKTDEDLKRITDLLIEKERHVKGLERHVKKAEKFREYRTELKQLDISLCSVIFEESNKNVIEIDKIRIKESAEMEGLKTEASALEVRVEEKKLLAIQKEDEVQIASKELQEVIQQINDYEKEMSLAGAHINGIKSKIELLESSYKNNDLKSKTLSENLLLVESNIAGYQSTLEERKHNFEVSKESFDSFSITLAEKRLELNEVNQSRINALESSSKLKSEISSINASSDGLVENSAMLERDVKRIKERLRECTDDIKNFQETLIQADSDFENLTSSRNKLFDTMEEQEVKYREALESEKNLESEFRSDKNKLQFFENIQKNHGGYKGAVTAVLEAEINGINHILADVMDVQNEMVSLVEASLGSKVQYIVADNREAANKGIEILHTNKKGKATFLIKDSIEECLRPESLTSLKDLDGVIGWGEEFVSFKEGFENLSGILFKDVLFVENLSMLETVKEKSANTYPIFLITPNGEVASTHGFLTGGETTEKDLGILSRGNMIDSLKESVTNLEQSLKDKKEEKQTIIKNISEAKKALYEVDENINKRKHIRQEQQTNIKHLDEEIIRQNNKENELIEQINSFAVRAEENRINVTRLEEELEVVTTAQDNNNKNVGDLSKEIDELEKERFEKSEKLKKAELEANDIHNRIESAKNEIKRIKTDIEDSYTAMDKSREGQDENKKAIVDFEDSIQDVQIKYTEILNIKKDKSAKSDTKKTELTTIQAEKDEDITTLRKVESSIRDFAQKVQKLEYDLKTKTDKKRGMLERMWEDWEIDLAALPDELEVDKEVDKSAYKEQINVLKKRLKAIGPNVSLDVLENYEEEKKLFDQLSAQKSDIDKAVNDLETLIKKLDHEAREKFIKTFDQVRANFKSVFVSLFEGGEADLKLEDDPDPLKAKIVIYARPAGKSMKSINLLSGGERALSAISLLFSLYLVKPSPYCILDEVDGPLDDANIGRFIGLLRKFADETQFLVVTHNKKTMAACDMLYGVTQQEPGISRTVSVQIESEEGNKQIDMFMKGNPA